MTAVGDEAGSGAAHEGQVIAGRYRLVRRLGAGGFGQVWQAVDTVLHVDVAIKQVWLAPSMSPEQTQERLVRAQREARSAARLRDHPHVVAVHDVVLADGAPWTVMQLVTGRSLAERLAADGPLPVGEAARIGVAVLSALGAAHAAGIVHRDVKPANIMLTDDGQVLLTDFGIAVRHEETALTASGGVIGSLEYMAPERVHGQEDGPAGDLFSLGVSLYEAVEGWSPFRRPTPTAALLAVATAEVPPPQRAGALAPVLAGLLVKDPQQRLAGPAAAALLAGAATAPVVTVLPAMPTVPATPFPPAPLAPPVAAPAPPAFAPQPPPVAAAPAPTITPAPPGRFRRHRKLIAVAATIAVVGAGSAVFVTRYSGRTELQQKLLQQSDMPAGYTRDDGDGDLGYYRPVSGTWSCAARNREAVWKHSAADAAEFSADAGPGAAPGQSVVSFSEQLKKASPAEIAGSLQAVRDEISQCGSYTVDLDVGRGEQQHCRVDVIALPAPSIGGDWVARQESYTCTESGSTTPDAPAVVEKLTTSKGGYLVEFFADIFPPDPQRADLITKALAKLP
ncbi:serine/threonine-protein kinase [Kitasatospora sp. LaBMicrA B282]|uniref:serine/threonine-protein kinase n=1 Tax=Kitasatospora sp. LaBMicrA B282 TaxID=3420949 RepID=UPI003D14CB60